MSAIQRLKVFLASSSELEPDRRAFELLVSRKNPEWIDKGLFLQTVVWEDFLDTLSKTRLQDEYNRAIRGCDLFVMLFHTKVGRYTEEEFDTARGQFQATEKPFIFTYYKTAPPPGGTVNPADQASLAAFQAKLKALGHYQTKYGNTDHLALHFYQQLDKLAAGGFVRLDAPPKEVVMAAAPSMYGEVKGGGALAQGAGATAVGQGGVNVRGNVSGSITTHVVHSAPQIDTGGGAYVGGRVDTGGGDFVGRDKVTHGLQAGELQHLFAPLLALVAQQAPPGQQAAAVQQVQALATEAAKGTKADDTKLGKLIDGLVGLVPSAVGTVASTFASPLLAGVAGPVTKFVLGKLGLGGTSQHGD